MEYTIRIPRICGDVIPLNCVAEAIAYAKASAPYNGLFNMGSYDFQLEHWKSQLLMQARERKLKVCDGFGSFIEFLDVYDEERSPAIGPSVSSYVTPPNFHKLKEDHPDAYVGNGEWDFSKVGVHLGETEPDLKESVLFRLYVKLAHLNEWGGESGDVYSIDHSNVEWVEYGGSGSLAGQPDSVSAGIAGNEGEKEQRKPYRRQGWQQTPAYDHVVEMYARLGHPSSKELCAALKKEATGDTPVGVKHGRLVVRATGKALSDKTIANALAAIRPQAAKLPRESHSPGKDSRE